MKLRGALIPALSMLPAGVDAFLARPPKTSSVQRTTDFAKWSVSTSFDARLSTSSSTARQSEASASGGEHQWTPRDAAEFVIFHQGEPEEAGALMNLVIAHWSGRELGEFLTRLYTGRPHENSLGVGYFSRNVRNPQWKGLGQSGIDALRRLLLTGLPDKVLQAQEIGRCAETFLLQPHEWKSTDTMKEIDRDYDSFARLGHADGIGMAFGDVWRERRGKFTAQDVVNMVSIPERKDKSLCPSQITGFYAGLGMELAPSEKIQVVEALAKSGWSPAALGIFVGTIKDVDESFANSEPLSSPPGFQASLQGTATASPEPQAAAAVPSGASAPAKTTPAASAPTAQETPASPEPVASASPRQETQAAPEPTVSAPPSQETPATPEPAVSASASYEATPASPERAAPPSSGQQGPPAVSSGETAQEVDNGTRRRSITPVDRRGSMFSHGMENSVYSTLSIARGNLQAPPPAPKRRPGVEPAQPQTQAPAQEQIPEQTQASKGGLVASGGTLEKVDSPETPQKSPTVVDGQEPNFYYGLQNTVYSTLSGFAAETLPGPGNY